jgi:cysteine desulfurase
VSRIPAGLAAPSPPPGFLDAASGEPLHPAARAARAEAEATAWADPARLYGAGRRSRQLLDGARESVAGVLGCRPDEVSFTSSGTRAVHLGIAGLALGRRRVGTHVVTGAVEHSAVLHAIDVLVAADGREVTTVGVDATGRVVGASTVARNITRRKQEENERLGLIKDLTAALAHAHF